MNWNKLKSDIENMTEEQRCKPVMFRVPTTDNIVKASCVIDNRGEEIPNIEKDQPYLETKD